MKKSPVTTVLATALAIASQNAAAADMEKCKIVKNGVGMIKANKADCSGGGHSCAGQNPSGDPEAWIVVPKGDCAKINAGDFTSVPKDVLDKIHVEEIKKS